MLKQGPAKKVTVYVGEDVHHRGEPLYLAILNYLFYHSVSGATVTKGVAGFGSHHRMRTTRILEMSDNLPVKIEFVEQAEKLDVILA
jgi:PII-like signaling protein